LAVGKTGRRLPGHRPQAPGAKADLTFPFELVQPPTANP
jgi:hypothetical protein